MTYLGVYGHVPIQHHAYTEDRLLGGRVGPKGLFFYVRGADIDFTHRLFGGPRKNWFTYAAMQVSHLYVQFTGLAAVGRL